MGTKISTLVDEIIWEDFKKLSKETHQKISHLLNEALRDYLRKKRVRPDFLRHLKDSAEENQKLGELLAE